MRRYLYPLAALLLTGLWTEAPAQMYREPDDAPQEQLHWHMDFGYNVTTGQTANSLRDGGSLGGGLSWQPDDGSPLALRADVHYSRFDTTRRVIGFDQTIGNRGYAGIVDLAVDGEYRMLLSPYMTAFTVGGIGVAHQRTAEDLVVAANTTRFAWNAGLGLGFALGRGQTFFVEAGFTRIQTPQPTDFVPIRVGMRF